MALLVVVVVVVAAAAYVPITTTTAGIEEKRLTQLPPVPTTATVVPPGPINGIGNGYSPISQTAVIPYQQGMALGQGSPVATVIVSAAELRQRAVVASVQAGIPCVFTTAIAYQVDTILCALYCTVRHCTVRHCTVWHCTVRYCNVLL